MAKKILDSTNFPYYSASLASALKAYADSGDLPNLLCLSDMELNDQAYALGWHPVYETLVAGRTYTLTILATVGDKDDSIGIYADGGTQTNIGTYNRDRSGTIRSFTFQAPAGTNQISFFHRPNDSDFATSTAVKWAVLTEGDRPARCWRPSPDDLRPAQRDVTLSSISAREFRMIKVGDTFYSSSRLHGPVINKTATTVQFFSIFDHALRTYARESGKLSLTATVPLLSADDMADSWHEVGFGPFLDSIVDSGVCAVRNEADDPTLPALWQKLKIQSNFPCRGIISGIVATSDTRAFFMPLSSVEKTSADFYYRANFGPVFINSKAWRVELTVYKTSSDSTSVCVYPV